MFIKRTYTQTIMYLLILLFLSSRTEIVRIQFASNVNLYLALYNFNEEYNTIPIFTATSFKRLGSLDNLCAKASIRRIDRDVFEFYFCGFKMCFDEIDTVLKACDGDEYNSKWELEKVDKGRTYLIRNNDFCVTLRDGRVQMEECAEGVLLDQIVHVIPELVPPHFNLSDDDSKNTRKKKAEKRFLDNENMYRLESIAMGLEEWNNGQWWH